MPYLKQDRKDALDAYLVDAKRVMYNTSGDLNYVITQILISFVEDQGRSYKALNDAVGALECAKLEFVRRVVNPYENSKIEDNGDVYPAKMIREKND